MMIVVVHHPIYLRVVLKVSCDEEYQGPLCTMVMWCICTYWRSNPTLHTFIICIAKTMLRKGEVVRIWIAEELYFCNEYCCWLTFCAERELLMKPKLKNTLILTESSCKSLCHVHIQPVVSNANGCIIYLMKAYFTLGQSICETQ